MEPLPQVVQDAVATSIKHANDSFWRSNVLKNLVAKMIQATAELAYESGREHVLRERLNKLQGHQ